MRYYTVLLSLSLVACSGAKLPPPMPAAEPEPAQPPLAVAPVSVAPAEPVPAPPSDKGTPRLSKTAYGSIEGKNVELYTLTNANGMVLKVTTYGAAMTELHV